MEPVTNTGGQKQGGVAPLLHGGSHNPHVARPGTARRDDVSGVDEEQMMQVNGHERALSWLPSRQGFSALTLSYSLRGCG
jgi:hypothetical protein